MGQFFLKSDVDCNIDGVGLVRERSNGVFRWLVNQGWSGLRSVQSLACGVVLGDLGAGLGANLGADNGSVFHNDCDLLISAGTASGKTEAAFLPVLSCVDGDLGLDGRVSVLYVAPLKALVNDQYRRLCDMVSYCGDVNVGMWHGDVGGGIKSRVLSEHSGVLLITPESLESFLVNRSEWCADFLLPDFVIVDEFHAFLDSGRGKQLLSLLARVDELRVARGLGCACRIGLSATLADLGTVGGLLSPGSLVSGDGERDCFIISDDVHGDGISVDFSVFGIEDECSSVDGEDPFSVVYDDMATHICDCFSGGKDIVFCESRSMVEEMTRRINNCFVSRGMVPCAFAHHGLLNKRVREELEERLVNGSQPTIAVATMTLELGIDVGDISIVHQVAPTVSVSSLRQRVGRSGRVDGIKRLDFLVPFRVSDKERLPVVHGIVEVDNMLRGVFEAPNPFRCDISVLFSETLSYIAQYSSYDSGKCLTIPDIYESLCVKGAFRNVSKWLFGSMMKDMVDGEFVMLMPDKSLVIAEKGEQELSDWQFYAVFKGDDELYTVKYKNSVIGQISVSPLAIGTLECFQLNGKSWKCDGPINIDSKTIKVKPSGSSAKYVNNASNTGRVLSWIVKRGSLSFLNGDLKNSVPNYVNMGTLSEINSAREHARLLRKNALGLEIAGYEEQGSETEKEAMERIRKGYTDDAIITFDPPVSSETVETIRLLLMLANDGYSLSPKMPLYRLHQLAVQALELADEYKDRKAELFTPSILNVIRQQEKNTVFLSDETLRLAYADELISLPMAVEWLLSFHRFMKLSVEERNKRSL